MIWSEGSLMALNSENDDDYQLARAKSTWKPNFAQIGGFLYFGGHFGFKMATIANQNGRHMVQHVLLPVNIHFHWNLYIFEFLTIYFNFILGDDLFLCQVSKGSAVRFPRNGPDKIDAEAGRIIRIIIIRNWAKVICFTNFVWEP